MNELELKQRLQYVDNAIQQMQQQLLQVANNPQAYSRVQYDLKNAQIERNNIINALNNIVSQQRQQPQQYNMYQQQPQQNPYQPQQQPQQNPYQQCTINTTDNGSAVASTSRFNNRPVKEPVVNTNTYGTTTPVVKKPIRPAIGNEFKPLLLPGLSCDEIVSDGTYRNEIKGSAVIGDIESDVATMKMIDVGRVIIDNSNSNGDDLKKYLLFTAHEDNKTSLAVDAVSRTEYLVDKLDKGKIINILKNSKNLTDLAKELSGLIVEPITERAIIAIDSQITDCLNHIVHNVAVGKFNIGSFLEDWIDVNKHIKTLNEITAFTIEANLESVMQQVKHIDVKSVPSDDYNGETVCIETYNKPITGLYIKSTIINDTLNSLKYDDVKMINSDVSQALYSVFERTRKETSNFKKTNICYMFTEANSYVLSYNTLTKYYTVVKRKC